MKKTKNRAFERVKHRKARIQRLRSWMRWRKPIFILVCLAIISVLGVTIYYSFQAPSRPFATGGAAILDQLSLFSRNPAFIANILNITRQVGFETDIYSGGNVTVELYRRLPSLGYRLIIIRAHAANVRLGSMENPQPWPTNLFTGEAYSSTRYVQEQLTGQVMRSSITPEPPYFFSIGPEFVKQSMQGSFNRAVVILCTCGNANNQDMEKALVDRGASVIIGFSASVLENYMDHAVECLLKHLLIDRLMVMNAVEATMREVGPDPAFKSFLFYYPTTKGAYNVWQLWGFEFTLLLQSSQSSSLFLSALTPETWKDRIEYACHIGIGIT